MDLMDRVDAAQKSLKLVAKKRAVESRLDHWLDDLTDRLDTLRGRPRSDPRRDAMFLAGGVGLGAALMYVLDPAGGRRRRALMRDQAVHVARETGDTLEGTARHARNRGYGMFAETRSLLRGRSAHNNGSGQEMIAANWSPATRFLLGATGGALAVYGGIRRDAAGALLATLGAGLVARALLNAPGRNIARLPGNAIEVHKSIDVQAPVSEVFTFWSHFENFPRFMSHLREVRDTGPGQSHWVASGPAGVPAEWDAIVTDQHPNEVIAWKSVPGSQVPNSGVVRFQPNPEGGTRIDVQMTYNPPAGAVGHAVASLFGDNPKQAMDDDLQRFKSLLEDQASAGQSQMSGRNIAGTGAGL